jgi:DNA-binding transcriptional ArsR family regulator
MPYQAGPVHEVKANLFRVLGHPARVRILELLRVGERSVGALQAELELDSGGTSQHLAALRRIGLVASRRDGTSVYYRVEDEGVFDLLAAGRAIITRRLSTDQSLLHELESE